MPRPSYYQDAGNPLQAHLLPRKKMPFEFPLVGETREANAKMRNNTLLTILVIDLCHSTIAYSVLGTLAPKFPLLFGLILATAIGIYLKGAPKACFVMLPGSVVAALLLHIGGKSSLVTLPILSGILSLYIYKFGKHWVHRCTLSPLPRAQASAIRDSQHDALLILSAVPFGAAVAAIMFDSLWLFSGTLLLASVIQFLATPRRWWALRYAKAAFTSWCAYNTTEVALPGMFRSPVGSAAYRRTFLTTSAICFALLCGYAGLTLTEGAANLPAFLFIPSLIFALTPIGILFPLLTQVVQVRHAISKTNHWSDLVDECRNSTNPIARDSYYMGEVASDGSPFLVHQKTFEEHAHFMGPSGSGKTSKGLCPWIEQTIRRGNSSIFVLDLKGDSLEMLASMAAGAQELEQRTGQQMALKVFSSMTDLPTHAFNPMSASFWGDLEINQKTDIICAALGLNYGTDYGAGYYSSANAAIVYEALQRFPSMRNLRELADRCSYLIQASVKSALHPEIKKSGVHVCEEIKRLAAFEQLQVYPPENGTDPVAEDAIDLASMFCEPQLLYVHLSSTLGASSAPTIARLFTYFLLASATQTKRRCNVFLVIDEFQRMASKSLEYLLQLARSLDIGVILSNQSMEDLKTLKSNLIPAIEANCQYRQWFDVGATEDLERIMKFSGERVEGFSSSSESVSSNGTTLSRGESEHILPRLSVNEIMTSGSHKDLSIVRIGRDAGYAQYGRFPFIVRSDFHISEDEYRRRRAFAWPEQTASMMIPKQLNQPDTGEVVGPVISREVDGTEDDRSNDAPGPLDELFDSLDESSKKRRKKKPRDNSQNEQGGDDETTE